MKLKETFNSCKHRDCDFLAICYFLQRPAIHRNQIFHNLNRLLRSNKPGRPSRLQIKKKFVQPTFATTTPLNDAAKIPESAAILESSAYCVAVYFLLHNSINNAT